MSTLIFNYKAIETIIKILLSVLPEIIKLINQLKDDEDDEKISPQSGV